MTSPSKNHRVQLMIRALLFCIVFMGILILFSMLKEFIPPEFERFSYGILGTIVALLTTWIFLRFEKRSFKDLGLKWEARTIKRFLTGLLIGLAIALIMIFCLLSFTGLKLVPVENYNILSFLIWTLALIPLAFMEEVAFRGYPFIRLTTATGVRTTQIIIAILFALYHFIGGQSLFSSFLGPGVWSFMFGLAMIMSGGISLPTGLHFGLNLVLAAVGTKPAFRSIWTIQYQAGESPAAQQQVETIGNVMQVVLFVVTIIMLEWHLRTRHKKTINAGTSLH